MPDSRHIPLSRWGEELRRRSRARGSRRLVVAATAGAAIAVAALGGTLLWPPRPSLVWNASASSPIGLYRVTDPVGLRRGDGVVAWLPAAWRRFAAQRHYLASGVPLVKRVAGVAGDRVCAVGEAVFVNGELAARRRREDGFGRTLPWWTGCELVRDGDLFLLMAGREGSLDGRYFGVTRQGDVIGRAELLWSR